MALLAVLVLAPLGLASWLALQLDRREDDAIDQQVRRLLESQLAEVDRTIAAELERTRRRLDAQLARTGLDSESLRELVARDPQVAQVLVLDPRGERLHPPATGPLPAAERAFVDRVAGIVADGELIRAGTEGLVPHASGWHVRFHERGIHLLYRVRRADGTVLAAEIDRVRLVSEIVGLLPDSSTLPDGFARLIDSRGRVVYQWGGLVPTGQPTAHITLSPPLGSWRLNYEIAARAAATPRSSLLVLVAALAVTLIALAAQFYRTYADDMRQAEHRVSLVNRASHELRTPLTNIRLYAELLRDGLDAGRDEDRHEADDASARQHADVIIAESQRLSRLVDDILVLSRIQRGLLRPQLQPGSIRDAVSQVLDRFRPSMRAHGMELRFTATGDDTPAIFDLAILEQILDNLLSNAQKHAAAGGIVEVDCAQAELQTVLRVRDHGLGIPASDRERVFEPFARLDDSVRSAAAGTGLGLSIARELAELHGGDLALEPTAGGACFRLTLPTPRAATPGAATPEAAP